MNTLRTTVDDIISTSRKSSNIRTDLVINIVIDLKLLTFCLFYNCLDSFPSEVEDERRGEEREDPSLRLFSNCSVNGNLLGNQTLCRPPDAHTQQATEPGPLLRTVFMCYNRLHVVVLYPFPCHVITVSFLCVITISMLLCVITISMLLLCNNCHNVIVCYTLEGLDNIQSERGSTKVKSSPRTGEPPRNQQPDKDPDEDYKPRLTPGGPPSACQRSVFRCCFTQHQIIFDCIFL